MAVARHLLSKLIWLTALCFAISVQSETIANNSDDYIARLNARTPEELQDILFRAQMWAGQFETYPSRPISIVLHGSEAHAFVKRNYHEHKELVDMAAKLDAFNIVDVQICETWMGLNNVSRKELPPFLQIVPFGPAEESRLIEAGYQQF